MTLKNPAFDMASFLDGQSLGGVSLVLGENLFCGPVRAHDRTPSPSVWLLNTSGPAPEPYLGSERAAYFSPSVQAVIRGSAVDFQAAEALGLELVRTLHQLVRPGYVSWLALESQPTYLGEDSDGHSLFSANFAAPYDGALS